MASFDKAFAAARKAGKKTFAWQGKSYNTKMASGPKLPSKGPIPASKPTASVTAKAAPAAKAASGFPGVPKLSILDRVKQNVAVGKTAVDRKHRREAATAKNAGAKASVEKMIGGMSKRKK